MNTQTAKVLSVTDLETLFKHDKPTANIMTITPTIAKYLLSTSAGNRRLRPWWVKVLAGAMSRGEWRVTSQGIGIDKNGRLRDAHHRLQGCCDSGVTIEMAVISGLDESAYAVTDTGLKRRTEDLLGTKKNIADVVMLGGVLFYGLSSLTADQLAPILESNFGAAAADLVEHCGTMRRYYSSAPVKLAAVCSVLLGSEPEYVFQQYRGLCTWDLPVLSAASQALVKQVETGKTVAMNRYDALARCLKVFDSTKKDLSKIYISDDDIAAAKQTVRKVIEHAVSD